MKRGKSADALMERDPYGRKLVTLGVEGEDIPEQDNSDGLDESGEIDHERARRLIREQTQRLLPPADANALADHLLVCDSCYKFAQDEAARERKRNSGELKL